MTAIRKHLVDVAALVVLVALATGVAGYVLTNQRLRFPWEATPIKLRAEFTTAQAVTPGQGQTVRVSGVRIGDISNVALTNGRAIVTMDVDPKFKGLVHTDAHALLRPKTGLKDMFVELDPGTRGAPVAPDGWTMPVANTLPDVNPDEIYGALDADTRDYVHLLIDDAGQGLKGRGADLRDVLRRFEPTHRDLARFASAVVVRRQNLRRLIHNLNVLNAELARHGTDLSQLVEQSSRVFRAFASQGTNISRAVGDLPGTLHQTTDALNKVRTFAQVLRPAAGDLVPAAHAIDRANHETTPFAIEAAPILRTQIRPFVRDARPLVRSLRPAAADLATATPDLTRSFVVLNHLFNLLGFNPNGREDPSKATRDEGYLFWLAWAGHNGLSLFSSADANGNFRPIALNGTCTTLAATIQNEAAGLNAPDQVAEFVTGLTGALTDPAVCGNK